MDWNKFKMKFGTQTTSNLDLIKHAKMLKIKPFRCLMRDEIKLLKGKDRFGYFIVNIHTSDQPGVHWSSIYSDKDKVYFFDSYALPPLKEIIDTFNHTNNRYCGDWHEQIQTFDKSYCGQISMYVLYKLFHCKKKTKNEFQNIINGIENEEKI